MRSDRRLQIVQLVLPLALLVGACGDYSNEDLEFMNALPQRSDLNADIPAVSSAVTLADEAELAQKTHDVTNTFNGLADTLVNLVDWIRSFPPTSRTPTTRTWGPFAADPKQLKNLDWQTRMTVSRTPDVPDQFTYQIQVHKDGTDPMAWLTFIDGSFVAAHTARRGMGQVEIVTSTVRAAGLDVSDLGSLDHLEIVYDTFDSPLTIDMTITDLPDPADPMAGDPPPVVTYRYAANGTGQGQMTFDLFANVVPGPAGVEDMQVTSSWLGTGAGRAQLKIVSGDGVGSTQTECWGPDFVATYNNKPWSATEDVPNPAPADPGGLCPDISAL